MSKKNTGVSKCPEWSPHQQLYSHLLELITLTEKRLSLREIIDIIRTLNVEVSKYRALDPENQILNPFRLFPDDADEHTLKSIAKQGPTYGVGIALGLPSSDQLLDELLDGIRVHLLAWKSGIENQKAFKLTDRFGERLLIVSLIESGAVAGNPCSEVLTVEAANDVRLQDYGDPMWFLRVYDGFAKLPAKSTSFSQFCLGRYGHRIQAVDDLLHNSFKNPDIPTIQRLLDVFNAANYNLKLAHNFVAEATQNAPALPNNIPLNVALDMANRSGGLVHVYESLNLASDKDARDSIQQLEIALQCQNEFTEEFESAVQALSQRLFDLGCDCNPLERFRYRRLRGRAEEAAKVMEELTCVIAEAIKRERAMASGERAYTREDRQHLFQGPGVVDSMHMDAQGVLRMAAKPLKNPYTIAIQKQDGRVETSDGLRARGPSKEAAQTVPTPSDQLSVAKSSATLCVPNITNAAEITIKYTKMGDTIDLLMNGKRHGRYTAAQLGLQDMKTLRVNSQWILLEMAARNGGKIPGSIKSKDVSLLRKKLTTLFPDIENPIRKVGASWKVTIQLVPNSE